MPRNSSGACTLAESPFVPNTPIRSADMNSDLDDIANMLTDSLSRSGKGGMQTTLDLAATGFAYSTDPDTGMSRPAANTQVITVGGVDWTFTETDLTNPDGVSLQPLVGEVRMWALPIAPPGWIFMRGQAATLAANPLWRAALIAAGSPYGTTGSDPRFPNMQCRLPAGFDADGLGLLTGSTTLGNTIGAQSVTLGVPNLPPYTPAGTIALGTLFANIDTRNYQIPGGPGALQDVSDLNGIPNTQEPVNLGGTLTFNGTAQGGTSTPFSVVQPTIILNFIGRDA